MTMFHRGDRVRRATDLNATGASATVVAVDPHASDSLLVDLDEGTVVAGLDFSITRWPLNETVLVRRGAPHPLDA